MPIRSNTSEYQPAPPYMRTARAGRVRTQDIPVVTDDPQNVFDFNGTNNVGTPPIVHIDRVGNRTIYHNRIHRLSPSTDPDTNTTL